MKSFLIAEAYGITREFEREPGKSRLGARVHFQLNYPMEKVDDEVSLYLASTAVTSGRVECSYCSSIRHNLERVLSGKAA